MATLDTAYHVPTLTGLCTTVGIACGLSVCCLVGFEILRNQTWARNLYAPRHYARQLRQPFGWLKGTIGLDEAYLCEHVGLDAAMYLRFLRTAAQFLTCQSVLACPILLTTHYYSLTHASQDDDLLYRLSIDHVPYRSPVCWVHVVLTYLVSLGWLWLLHRNHQRHRLLVQRYGTPLSTVLVRNIPPSWRNAQVLRQLFSSDYGPVDTVSLVLASYTRLASLWKEREQLLDQLEYNNVAPFLYEKIQRLNQQIYEARASSEPTGTAFVTFKTAEAAGICCKSGFVDAQMAPEPSDLYWPGLLRRRGWSRRWIVSLSVWSLTIFWLFPVICVLNWLSIPSLSRRSKFLRHLLDTSEMARSFVQNLMPTLLVVLFMSLAPWMLLALSKQQDYLSYSQLQDQVLKRYYRFAIFNILIVFLLGSTFLTTLLNVLHKPSSVFRLLATFLPQGASFFLNYIVFNTSSHAMELLQLGSQLFGHCAAVMLCRTPRQRERRTRPWTFPYYYYYPNHILIFVIALTYSMIQPLVLPAAAVYFGLAVVCFKHQLACCYVGQRDGTTYYRRMEGYTSDGLLILQLTVLGLLSFKGLLTAAAAVLPLVPITLWIKIRLASKPLPDLKRGSDYAYPLLLQPLSLAGPDPHWLP